jgi:hypothetical protein
MNDESRFHSEWLIGKWQVIEQGLDEESIKPVNPDDYCFFYTLYVHEFQSDGIYRCTNDKNEVFERNYFTKNSLLFQYVPSITSKEEIEKSFPDCAYNELTFYGRDTLKIVPRGFVPYDMSPKAFIYKRIE